MVQHHLEAVVLDLDGTLLDSERVICDAVSRACARLGQEVAPGDVAPHLGAPLTELYALYFRANGPLKSGEAVEATLVDDAGYRAFTMPTLPNTMRTKRTDLAFCRVQKRRCVRWQTAASRWR